MADTLPPPPVKTSRLQYLPYALSLAGIGTGVTAHVALALHTTVYSFSALELLWTALPFLLAAAAAYAVRHFWYLEIAVAFVTILLLLCCWRYTGVTDDDHQPFFILGFMPFFQLWLVVAFLTPVLIAAFFAHQRRIDALPTRRLRG
jgi:hypothetical protein